MKRKLFIALVSLMTAMSPLYAAQSLSISGPSNWTPGTSIVLNVFDTYSGFGEGSFGVSYWLQVNFAIAPFLTITGASYFTPFNDPNYNPPPPFPAGFTDTSGADTGFLSTREQTGQMRTADLGSTGALTPDGTYHVTDVTFALATNAPLGAYTLRTTTASPRGSIQLAPFRGDEPFPQASFFFNIVPEPSTLALMALAAVGAGIVAYRCRK